MRSIIQRFGRAFGACWHFFWTLPRRRSYPDDAIPSESGTAPPPQTQDVSPEELKQVEGEAFRTGASFVAWSGLAYFLVMRTLIRDPQVSDPAIPGIIGGGVIGLAIALRFPYNPTRDKIRPDPIDRGPPARIADLHAKRGHDLLLRLRTPWIIVAVHLPYCAMLVAVYLTSPASLRVLASVTSWAYLIVFMIVGSAGPLASGWGLQILQVWSALRRQARESG